MVVEGVTVLKITLCKDWCDVCSCIGDSGSWIGMQRIFLPSQLPKRFVQSVGTLQSFDE